MRSESRKAGPVEPFLVGVATLSLLSEAAEESPVLCVVDDAPWLDSASADALLFAARRIEAERVAMVFAAHAARNGRDELSMAPEVFEQARALNTLRDRPLAVLTASENLTTPGWTDAQDELASLSTQRVHRVVDSTHAGMLEDEDGAAASVDGITQVVASVRSGAPLVTQ